MARYRKIDVRMYSDDKFRSLSRPAPNGRDCWIHLLTNRETSNIPGVYRAYEETLARDLGWSVEGYREAFDEVSGKGMARADWTVGLVFIPNAIRHNPPESPNVVIGWRVAWEELPECKLKHEAWRNLKAFTEGMGEAFAKAFAKALPDPSPNQEQEQDQEQEQEEERENASARPPLPAPQLRLIAPESAPEGLQAQAERVLAELNAARKRVDPATTGLRPVKTNLGKIRAILQAGNTVEDCLHVIAVYEAESRVNEQTRKDYFNASSPFRPENFSRALSRKPEDARAPLKLAPGGRERGHAMNDESRAVVDALGPGRNQ